MIDRAQHIRGEADRLGSALAGADPAARVPTCPEWNAVDLLTHFTRVHRFWAAVIGQRMSADDVERYGEGPALPHDRDELLERRRQATADLVGALESRDPSEPAWSWFPGDQTVGFTWRMQTHEATVHRVDAELTAGRPVSPIPTEVATEGIDHIFDVMWAWAPPDAARQVTGIVELEASDIDRKWLARTFRWSGHAWGEDFEDQIGCERPAAGPADAVVSGTAQDLYLLLWGRSDHDIRRSGDGRALREFQAMLDNGIP